MQAPCFVRSAYRYKTQGPVSNRTTDVCSAARYDAEMSNEIMSDWLKSALDFSGMGQAELARELTRVLKRSIDRAAVNKMLVSRPKRGQKSRRISGAELVAISQITGYPAPQAATEAGHTVAVDLRSEATRRGLADFKVFGTVEGGAGGAASRRHRPRPFRQAR